MKNKSPFAEKEVVGENGNTRGRTTTNATTTTARETAKMIHIVLFTGVFALVVTITVFCPGVPV